LTPEPDQRKLNLLKDPKFVKRLSPLLEEYCCLRLENRDARKTAALIKGVIGHTIKTDTFFNALELCINARRSEFQ